jgi:hypothetical protein
MASLGSKVLEEKTNIDDMLVEKEEGVCSTDNISISNNTALIKGVDMGIVNDEYDPGF